ncbi:polymorphic toxin type 44 domain-containing protein [Phytomonospora sp. NPDC050363]|uniref:polymorphic toxin type 44 domain-containing protein n=1 Tax=Phytomonospora sp. NPDC050363 TaxID=3155642 RepID=UPI00340C5237
MVTWTQLRRTDVAGIDQRAEVALKLSAEIRGYTDHIESAHKGIPAAWEGEDATAAATAVANRANDYNQASHAYRMIASALSSFTVTVRHAQRFAEEGEHWAAKAGYRVEDSGTLVPVRPVPFGNGMLAMAQGAVRRALELARQADTRLSAELSSVVLPTAPGEVRPQRLDPDQFDEIAAYIADEMRRNALSPEAADIKYWNRAVIPVVAHAKFWDMVATGHPWDHKWQIAQKWGMDTGDLNSLYSWVDEKNAGLRYDVWSNIHYGYVGRHAGFSEQGLLDSANATWLPGTGGQIDAADDVAIRLGYDLYNRYPPDQITPALVRQTVIDAWPKFEAATAAQRLANEAAGKDPGRFLVIE